MYICIVHACFYGIQQFISHFGGFVNQVKHPFFPNSKIYDFYGDNICNLSNNLCKEMSTF